MPTSPTVPLREELAALEKILRRQLDGHRSLLACVRESREAVRRADIEQVRTICERENAIVQDLAELEKSRLVLVGRITERLEPDAASPLPVSRIIEAADEPAGRRLAALAAQLRGAVEEVRAASAVVRAAGDALARHMTGLMQTVQSMLGRAGVYGRKGRVEAGGQGQFCVDVRS